MFCFSLAACNIQQQSQGGAASSSSAATAGDAESSIANLDHGDTLSVTTTVLDVRPSSSKPDRGVVHTMWEAKNQHGETVATVKGMGMFMRRPKQP